MPNAHTILLDHETSSQSRTWLKTKMRARPPKSFSCNFHLTSSIKPFSSPWCIKISYKEQIIAVLDHDGKKLFIFDLLTRNCIGYVSLDGRYFDFEERKGKVWIIVVCEDNSIYKYGISIALKKIRDSNLRFSGEIACPIEWKVMTDKASNLIVDNWRRSDGFKCLDHDEGSLIYVSHVSDMSISILNSKDGTLIKRISHLKQSLASLSHPKLFLGRDGELILCDNKIWIVAFGNGEMILKKEVSDENFEAEALVVDEQSGNMIVSNWLSKTISIYGPSGTLIKRFSDEILGHCCGCCINTLSGQLLVCSSSSRSVYIFK